jgi:hypothetical protein
MFLKSVASFDDKHSSLEFTKKFPSLAQFYKKNYGRNLQIFGIG